MALAGSVIGGLAAMEHRSVRVEYEAESALLEAGGYGYDGRRSDELYQATFALVARARNAGWFAALGWLLIALGVGTPRDRQLGAILDAAVVGGLAATHFYVEGWLGVGWAGVGAHLAAQVVGLALAWAWLRLRLTSTAG